jgi:phage gp46-like protein
MIDLMFIETGDGGDFDYDENGYLTPINGLQNQVYLALFGGNDEWWGNVLMKPENQFLSTFENTLKEVALNSSGVSKLEEAALNDLKYLKKYAEISVVGSIIGHNRFQLEVFLQEPNQQEEKITFIWDGTKQDLIYNSIN